MAERSEEIALYIDFENLAHGFTRSGQEEFDIERVLARLVEKGKVVMKRAYCDWSRFAKYKGALHEAGIELVEIPRRSLTGKNSADIRLVVDAMDMCYSKGHISTFVIASGDSDFSPLVSKLKENGKHVIGLGMKDSTSELLVSNCDEFIFYEDLEAPEAAHPRIPSDLPKQKREAFGLLLDSLDALQRENVGILWSSIVKETMKRKRPSFTERGHGYRTFSDLLEDAQRGGLVSLRKDERSGSYIVTGLGGGRANGEGGNGREAPAVPPVHSAPAARRRSRRKASVKSKASAPEE
ncbi:MAG: NYN domain-containing protein [Candidatus Tectomicrobia bacterium]|nr:NYN domain-containing protein [Candidatus Tectomicrobia bacterium]MBI3026140.1 NYN domain-containing protein [Candidatus Tectomicrobia bacterium]